MIDQYIYSRADGAGIGKSKHLGFGLIDYTEGLQEPSVQQGLTDISYYASEITDDQKRPLEILTRRRVPRTDGKIALFMSKMILPAKSRSFLHCHGYTMDASDADAIHPDAWFYQNYYRENVNESTFSLQTMEALPGTPTALWPLSGMLRKTGISLEAFIGIVKSCFDAKNNKSTVIVAVDFKDPQYREISAQLIRWIYHFLPYDMRREAGFTTCYDNNCLGGGLTLVLIPANLIVERGSKISIEARKKPNSMSYIFANNQLVHAKQADRKELLFSNRIYSRWLGQLIRMVYQQDAAAMMDTLKIVDEIYAYMEPLMTTLPVAERNLEKYMNAACFMYLNSAEYKGRRIEALESLKSDPEFEAEYIHDMMAFSKEELQKNIRFVLQKAVTGCSNGFSENWIETLCSIHKMNMYRTAIREINTIYLARLLDEQADRGVIVNFNYFSRLVDEVYSLSEQKQILETTLYPEMITQPDYWKYAQMDCSEDAGQARRIRMIREELSDCRNLSSAMKQLDSCLEKLFWFSDAHAEQAVDILVQAASAIDISSMDVRIPGLIEICNEKQSLLEKYPLLNDALMHIFSAMESGAFESCEADLKEAPVMSHADDWMQSWKKIKSNPHAALWWHAGLKALMERVNRAAAWDDLKVVLEPEEWIYDWSCEVISAAKELGIPDSVNKKFFVQVIRYIIHGVSRIPIDRTWFRELDATAPYSINQLVKESGSEDMMILSILQNYICEEKESLKELDKMMDRAVLSLDLKPKRIERLTLEVLAQMFKRGDYNSLDIAVLDRWFMMIRKGDPDPEDRAEFFKNVLHKKSPQEFLDLLNEYPSAMAGEPYEDEEEESGSRNLLKGLASRFPRRKDEADEPKFEYDVRPGVYPWMEMNEDVLLMIRIMIEDEEFLDFLLDSCEMFGSGLIDEVDMIAPAGSVLEKKGSSLKKTIYEACRHSKFLSSEAQKEMKNLKKQGIL